MTTFDQMTAPADAATHETETETEKTLSEIAREALERADWNVEKAALSLAQRVQEDGQLLLLLVTEYLGSIEGSRRVATRAAIRSAYTNADHSSQSRRVHALAAGNARMLLDWPLPDGTKLRNATKAQLRDAAERTYKQADTMRHDSRWYALVAAKMPEGNKRVGTVLDEGALQKLREKAKHAKS